MAAIKPPDLRFQCGAFALYASAAMLRKVTTNTPTYKVALISPLRNGIVLSRFTKSESNSAKRAAAWLGLKWSRYNNNSCLRKLHGRFRPFCA
jgi:hypothetical protein